MFPFMSVCVIFNMSGILNAFAYFCTRECVSIIVAYRSFRDKREIFYSDCSPLPYNKRLSKYFSISHICLNRKTHCFRRFPCPLLTKSHGRKWLLSLESKRHLQGEASFRHATKKVLRHHDSCNATERVGPRSASMPALSSLFSFNYL